MTNCIGKKFLNWIGLFFRNLKTSLTNFLASPIDIFPSLHSSDLFNKFNNLISILLPNRFKTCSP